MKLILRVILFFLILTCPAITFAQDSPEMADVMRSNGKIYVVVAVCLLILTGLFLYVWMVDRKISKIEKGSALNK